MCNLPRMKNDCTDEALLEWQARQPASFTGDPLWRLDTYRESLYLADRVRADVIEAGVPGSYAAMKEQLLTSVGSIAANIAGGDGRPTTADRVACLLFALGYRRGPARGGRKFAPWYPQPAHASPFLTPSSLARRQVAPHPSPVALLDPLAVTSEELP